MNDNFKKIRKLPLIIDAKRINFKKEKDIFVYEIIYKSQGHKVIGYIIEPKYGKKLSNIIWNRGGSIGGARIRTT